MFNQVNAIPPVPRETARCAKAIFGRSNFYIQVGEHLNDIMENIRATYLLESGIMAPQITFFQYLENLTDMQAIDAVQSRLDWKFALHLPIYPPILHKRTLCVFRQKILIDPACQREFQNLVDRLVLFNPPLQSKSLDVEILEMISLICSANRLGLFYEMFCQAIESLAYRYPVWLRQVAHPQWYGRYNRVGPGFGVSASLNQQELSIQEIGADIHYLLEEVRCSELDGIKELQEIKTLDHIWMRQIEKTSRGSGGKSKFLNSDECEFCIYRERRFLDGLYQ